MAQASDFADADTDQQFNKAVVATLRERGHKAAAEYTENVLMNNSRAHDPSEIVEEEAELTAPSAEEVAEVLVDALEEMNPEGLELQRQRIAGENGGA